MPLFHFELCRNGRKICRTETRDCPDCGMAFRAARDMIRTLREADTLNDKVRDHPLRVSYVDHSTLFDLPLNLGI